MHGITPALMEAARQDVYNVLSPTPFQPSLSLSERIGRRVWLKLETIQPIRTYKIRGAVARFSALARQGYNGPVVTCSAGNHGLAVAWCGRRWGWPAHVFVPENANTAKVKAIRLQGGHVQMQGEDYQHAFEVACTFAQEKGWPFIHGYDDPELIAGQGTVGTEILDEPSIGTIIAGVGGGGLLSGIALAVKPYRPQMRLIGIEPEGAASMRGALDAGHVIRLEHVSTIADGLAPGQVSERTLEIFQSHVDEVRTVPDDAFWPAMEHLLLEEHLVTEPAGAAPLAALLKDPSLGEGDIALVLSGANLSERDLATLLKKAGLA